MPPTPFASACRGCAEWTQLENLDVRAGKKNVCKLPEEVFEALKPRVAALRAEGGVGPESRTGVAAIAKSKKPAKKG